MKTKKKRGLFIWVIFIILMIYALTLLYPFFYLLYLKKPENIIFFVYHIKKLIKIKHFIINHIQAIAKNFVILFYINVRHKEAL